MRSSRSAAAVAVVMFMTAAPITVQPSRHDFGDVAVSAMVSRSFRVSTPPGADSTISFSITGADAADFATSAADSTGLCFRSLAQSGNAGGCNHTVYFTPKSIGIKTANLVVTDTRGNRGIASLAGKGVGAICQIKVVSCNYSHLYTGVVRWTEVIRGPQGSTTATVQVDVVLGRATCNGSEASFNARSGITRRGAITGNGLVAVEFDNDEQGNLVYNVTVACPSPAYAATAEEPATPSRPAELGDFFQESYKQPAAYVGMDLVGSTSNPAADTDPLNGVDGTVTMSWSLKRS